MFKRVSNLEWQQREEVRLRVARLRVTARARRDRPGRVSLARSLQPASAVASRRFEAIPGWLRRLLSPGQRRRG